MTRAKVWAGKKRLKRSDLFRGLQIHRRLLLTAMNSAGLLNDSAQKNSWAENAARKIEFRH